MNLAGHDIGVCSWSLKPKSAAELIGHLDALGLDHVQLALVPLLQMDEATRQAEVDALNAAEVSITAGMIGFDGENYATIAMIRKTGGLVPTDLWPARRDRALAAGELAQAIGIDRVSFHLGFIPPGNDPTYKVLVDRTCEIAKAWGERGIDLVLETGQERASDLLLFLNDLNCRNVGVNFDPANMLLYGAGDPVEAVEHLGRHIRHVHIKDAVASDRPGVEWGKEVAFGEGEVDGTEFLRALLDVGYDGPLVIEREAGEQRLDDLRAAVAKLQALLA
jgi:L-ribulose-5-phosphate 3-epimerase